MSALCGGERGFSWWSGDGHRSWHRSGNIFMITCSLLIWWSFVISRLMPSSLFEVLCCARNPGGCIISSIILSVMMFIFIKTPYLTSTTSRNRSRPMLTASESSAYLRGVLFNTRSESIAYLSGALFSTPQGGY